MPPASTIRKPPTAGGPKSITLEGAVPNSPRRKHTMTALVVYLQNTWARLRDREGQTMAEYALILGGIAILVIAGILILGPAVRDLFKSTGSSVQKFPTG